MAKLILSPAGQPINFEFVVKMSLPTPVGTTLDEMAEDSVDVGDPQDGNNHLPHFIKITYSQGPIKSDTYYFKSGEDAFDSFNRIRKELEFKA